MIIKWSKTLFNKTTTKYDPLKAVKSLAEDVKELDRRLGENHAEGVADFGETCPDEHIDYFGGCPECGHCDGTLNIGRDHHHVCHKHKKRWMVGSNLFSNWREESEIDWLVNRLLLETYETAESIISETMLRESEAKAKERKREQFCEDVPF